MSDGRHSLRHQKLRHPVLEIGKKRVVGFKPEVYEEAVGG
jgi:hypothetical protein